MDRQGRILVVDDELTWRNQVSRTLKRAGFHVETAASTAEARQKLSSDLFHLAVLDIRMVDRDDTNVEGMGLLRELHERGLLGALKVIMLSAYGTKAQMRESFSQHGVTDFYSKEEYKTGKEFVETVRRAIDQIHVNLGLDIFWEPAEAAQSFVEDLRIDGVRVKKDAELASRLPAELDDLLCRLLSEARRVVLRALPPGLSGSGVLWAQYYTDRGPAEPVVIKIGDARDIEQEHHNFKTYVEGFVGGNRSTTVRALSRTQHLGGIVYSFMGVEGRQFESFERFYRRVELPVIRELLDRLFLKTCARWYKHPGQLQPYDLALDYRNLLGLTAARLKQAITERLKSVQGETRLRFQALDDRTFTNPTAAVDGRLLRSTYTSTTHGDLNQHNILVDEAGYPWLIDFLRTGVGHVLRDVAQLDAAVRFQLLAPEEASLEERLEIERALCSIDRFRQVDQLQTSFVTENPAAAKAYGTSIHLRRIAAELMVQNPDDDFGEYLIASFFYALNTLRFYSLPKIQREHALLCASLITDRLGL